MVPGTIGEIIDKLICPSCKSTLELNSSELGLVCTGCSAYFEISQGIPIILLTDSSQLKSTDEKARP